MPGITLYDKDGRPQTFSNTSAAQRYVESGEGFAPQGTKFHVLGKDGNVSQVPIEKLNDTFKSGGLLWTPEMAAKKEHEDKYGGIGGMAASAAEGVNQTALFGAANALLPDSAKEYVRESVAENPGSNIAGQAVGLIAPIAADVLTAGTATPELLAGEAAAQGAKVALKTAAREVLPEAGEVLGRAVGAEAAPSILKTAGSIIAAPNRALSAVGDVTGNLTEQAIRAIAGPEATSALGQMARKGLTMGVKGATEGGLIGVAQTAGDEMLNEHPDLTAEKLMHGGLFGALIGGVGGGILGMGGVAASKFDGPVSRQLDNAGERLASKAAFGKASSELDEGLLERANKLEGGHEAIVKTLQNEHLIQAGDSITNISPRITAARQVAEQDLLKLQQDAGIIAPVVEAPVAHTFEEAHKFMNTEAGQTKLAELLKESKSPQVIMDDLQNKRIPEGLYDSPKAVTSPENLAPEVLKKIDDAKLKLDRLTIADEAAQAHLEEISKKGEGVIGPSMLFHGLSSLASGNIIGAAHGIGGALIKGAIHDRGVSTAAVALDKLASAHALTRISENADKAISGIVSSSVHNIQNSPYEHKIEMPKDYESVKDKIIKAAISPDNTFERIRTSVSQYEAQHPKAAAAYVNKSAQGLAWLASQIPQGEHPNPNSLQPQLDKREISPEEKDHFLLKAEAVNNPIGSIAKIKDGTMTMEERDAIIAVYPETYKDTCMKLKKELDVSKVALEYQTETSIRMFMKLPQVSLQLSTILLAPPMQPSITPQGPKSGKTKAPKVIKEDFSKGFKLE